MREQAQGDNTELLKVDLLKWKNNTDEIHTVAFLSGAPISDIVPVPGGGPTDLMIDPQTAFPSRAPGAPVEVYSGTGTVHSGILSDVPPAPDAPGNDTFSLVFDTPGTYQFVCEIHSFMRGRVQVLAATAADVPSQTQIDAQGRQQLAPLMAELEGLKARRDSGLAISSEPGPNGTTIWQVGAGGRGIDRFEELFDFLAKDVTIAEGDTVVWSSPAFHNVTFHPGRDAPEAVLPTPQEQGPPQLRLNPKVFFLSKPTGEFDGTGFFSAGVTGPDTRSGATSFSMTFTKAGSYNYMCALHKDLGMKGSITVVPRDQAGGLSTTIAFQDFGWDPNHTGATGSVTYRPLANSFEEELEEAEEESGTEAATEAPRIISETFGWAHSEGLNFASHLYSQGGFGAIDRAFSEPQQSTEQIIHPQKLLDGEAPHLIELPDIALAVGQGWAEQEEGTLGEFMTGVYLGTFVDQEQAESGAEGWGGDRYSLLKDDEDRWMITMLHSWDSGIDAEEYFQLYLDFVEVKSQGLWELKPDIDGNLMWTGDDAALYLGIQGNRTLTIIGPDLASVEAARDVIPVP